MSEYFPKPLGSYRENIKIKVNLSNYATKADIKNITHVDTWGFALKTSFANLKTEVDKLDIGKLVTVPVDLSKLSNVVKNEIIKKTEYNKLVGKVNNIDTSDFVLKTKYNTDKTELENKIPDISNLIKKSDDNTKISEIGNKIPSISNLTTTSALTAVENKIPSISNLVKKTDYNEIGKKLTDDYITTPKFNKLATDVFNARITQANLITKTDFDAKLFSLNKKITSSKTRHLLINNELSYFQGKNYFDEDGTQNYLVFIPISRYFRLRLITNVIAYPLPWQSKGLSSESIKAVSTSNNSLTPALDYYDTSKIRVKFSRSCLKQDKSTIDHKNVINIYIVYELSASSSNNNDPTIKNCLFGAVTLTKNADIDKYRYSGYGIEFDRRSSFSFPGDGFGQNKIIFGGDLNLSPHIDNRGKDILILGRGPTQGLGEHSLTAEKMYSINFIVTKNIMFKFTL